MTPLHFAVWFNENIDIAKLLISEGASIDTKDNNGDTPLHVAVMFNENTEIITFLTSLGANVNAKNNDGVTPLDIAKERGKEENGDN